MHVKPADLEDMIDGLLFIDAHQYIKERAIEEAKAENNGKV